MDFIYVELKGDAPPTATRPVSRPGIQLRPLMPKVLDALRIVKAGEVVSVGD